ncbi:uncharacterized protein LOC110710010 [Chenopodium quinoa]|uniref:uncharacterized protein LOC110710010 n=1 Tax=Chenopodium quinoa TaxID=63459 RepID=UPI000B7713EC|nr:uncharacterized protein LOC110710010 [Chenopodium quinoa]
MDIVVTLKMWCGGSFKKDNGVLQYFGGECRTFELDSDQLCWFWLEEFAKSCAGESKIEIIYYLISRFDGLEKGLRRVYSDDEIREMSKIAVRDKCVECYVVYEKDELVESVSPKNRVSKGKPCTPRRNKNVSETICDTLFSKDDIESTFLHMTPTSQTNPTKQNWQNSFFNLLTCNSPINTSFNELNTTKDVLHPENSQAPPLTQTQLHSPIQNNHAKQRDHFIQPVDPNYSWEDPRDEEAVDWGTFFGGYEVDPDDYDNDDPDYEVDFDLAGGLVGVQGKEPNFEEDFEDEIEHELDNEGGAEYEEELEEQIPPSDGGTSDEEYVNTREQLKGWNTKAVDMALQLQKEAEQRKLAGQRQNTQNREGDGVIVNDFLSEYEDSEEEIATPDEHEEEDNILLRKRRVRVPVVDNSTDFNKLQWKVGIRFENREKFRDVVKYAIAQGRNLFWCISDKKRQQRLGARCVGNCPFKIYASWENRRSCFVVKSVTLQHTCNRNMELNRQLKSSWVAEQLLEVFKSRPHWPAKDIIETIRLAYKIIVKKNYAYKVK